MLRMEELRKSYDSVSDFETMVKMVESNPDLEIYVYMQYSAFAGGENREVKIPVKPNSRMLKLLCEGEKERLYKELGKASFRFRIPFRDS